MADECRNPDAAANPGLASAPRSARRPLAGRDKLTVISGPRLASFGDWAEQLVAESTGKAGNGIVPVVGEPIGAPGDYGDDRFFVLLTLANEPADDARRCSPLD